MTEIVQYDTDEEETLRTEQGRYRNSASTMRMNTHSKLPLNPRLASLQVPTTTMGVKSSLAWARTWPAESLARRSSASRSVISVYDDVKSCAMV